MLDILKTRIKKKTSLEETHSSPGIPFTLSGVKPGFFSPSIGATFHPFRLLASRLPLPLIDSDRLLSLPRVAKQKRLPPHPLLCENQACATANISRTHSLLAKVGARIVPRLYKVYHGPLRPAEKHHGQH